MSFKIGLYFKKKFSEFNLATFATAPKNMHSAVRKIRTWIYLMNPFQNMELIPRGAFIHLFSFHMPTLWAYMSEK